MRCGDTYPASVGALAAAVAQGLSEEQIGFLAALFTLLGDSLALILATRACAERPTSSNERPSDA